MIFNKYIERYIAKKFVFYTLLLVGFLSFLIFVSEFMDIMGDILEDELPIRIGIAIILLKIPYWFEATFPFIIFLATIFTYLKFSYTSELNVMRAGGYSFRQLIRPTAYTALLIGILFSTIISPLSSHGLAKSEQLENKYIRGETEQNLLIPKDGIWIKQNGYNKNGGEEIIRSEKFEPDTNTFRNATILFFDNNGVLYKKIESDQIIFDKTKFWKIGKAKITEHHKKTYDNEEIILIPSNLSEDFIKNLITQKFTSIEKISFWRLPFLIKNLKEANLNPIKFQLKFYSLMLMPILFLGMVFLGVNFGFVNKRAGKGLSSIINGLGMGFVLFFCIHIVLELGGSNKINPVLAGISIPIIYICLGIYKISKKQSG